MSHGFSTDTLSQEPLLPNQPFFSWLRSQTGLFISQILAVISFLASLGYYLISLRHEEIPLEPKDITVMVVYAHLLFLIIFIVALIQVLDDNEQGSYRVSKVYDRLFGPHFTPEETDVLLKRSKDHLKRFKLYFLLFWCSMFLLYVGFAFKYGVELSISQPKSSFRQVVPLIAAGEGDDSGPTLKAIAINVEPRRTDGDRTEADPQSQSLSLANVDKLALSFIPFALNNLSLLFVFWCFVVLYAPSKRSHYVFDRLRKKLQYRLRNELHRRQAARSPSSHDSKETPPEKSSGARRLRGLGLSAAVFMLKRNRVLPKRQRLLWILSTLGVIGLTASYWVLLPNSEMSSNAIQNYVVIFNSLSGILNAIVLALLIARLDSKLIGLPSWLICLLYLYAAVQPLFFAFEIFPQIAAAVLIVVFIFKIYFFLIIMYTLQTGRMLNYFFCFPFVARRLTHLRTSKSPGLAGKPENSSSNRAGSERLITRLLSPQVMRPISFVLGILGVGWLWFLLPYFARRVAQGDYRGAITDSKVLTLAFDGFHLFFALVIIVVISFLRASQRKHANESEDAKTIERVYQGILHEPSPQPEALRRSQEQLLKFEHYFRLFWVFIFALYLALGYKHLTEWDQPASQPSIKVSVQAVPSSGTLFLGANGLGIGGVDAQNSAPVELFTGQPPVSNHQQFQTNPNEKLNGLRQVFGELWDRGLIFALNNFSLLFLFYCFLVLYLPALDDESERKQKLLCRYGLFFVVMLTLAFFALITLPALQGMTRNSVQAYAIVFNGISGTLNAVALALLIARLDSKLIDISSFLIFVLLTYAGLQPIFAIFEAKEDPFIGLQTLVVVSALLFKLCFFLVLMDSWRTGTMRTYLFCFPLINKRIDSIFENQFEFKTSRERDGFRLSILKKNASVYSTDTTFDSRSQCDERAEKLRQLMRDERNYDYREQAGTHWVVVNDHSFREKAGVFLIIVNDEKKYHSLCESITLRSKDEAVKLVKESVDKVPHCKYNRS